MFRRYLPYALDRDGHSILPVAANRMKRSSLKYGYVCPECKSPVQRFAETGGKQALHFRHLASNGSTAGCCYGTGIGESATHRRACHAVKAMLLVAFAGECGGQQVVIEARCETHGRRHVVHWKPAGRDIRIDQPLPSDASSTEANPGYRPDVVVYRDDGRVDLIIEIRHRHEISFEKADYYCRRNFEWMEVLTDDLETSTSRLQARQHGFVMPCCADVNNHVFEARGWQPTENLRQLPAVVCRRRPMGTTPWRALLEFDGRHWREVKPLAPPELALSQAAVAPGVWARGPSGHLRRVDPMWRASRAPLAPEDEAKALAVATDIRKFKIGQKDAVIDVPVLLNEAMNARAHGVSLEQKLVEWKHRFQLADTNRLIDVLAAARIVLSW